jgi:hypothetical protein
VQLNPRMQPTKPEWARPSLRAHRALSALRNVHLCGRRHAGLQLMRMSLGRPRFPEGFVRTQFKLPRVTWTVAIVFGLTGCFGWGPYEPPAPLSQSPEIALSATSYTGR